MVPAVEFAIGGERNVIDVQIEPHADGVGGDDVIDLARLIERHLRVARARTERAQNDRRAAPLATDELGDGVDLLGGERDDGAAPRQAGNLALAGEG